VAGVGRRGLGGLEHRGSATAVRVERPGLNAPGSATAVRVQ